jgi:hypothetical protein
MSTAVASRYTSTMRPSQGRSSRHGRLAVHQRGATKHRDEGSATQNQASRPARRTSRRTLEQVPDEIEGFLRDRNKEVAAIARAARRLILDVFPEVRETLDRGNRIVGYATGPRAIKDMWAGVAPHNTHVNLQLANGALIEDPAGLLEGTGKRVRHVKLRSVEEVDRPQLRRLLEASLARHRSQSS